MSKAKSKTELEPSKSAVPNRFWLSDMLETNPLDNLQIFLLKFLQTFFSVFDKGVIIIFVAFLAILFILFTFFAVLGFN